MYVTAPIIIKKNCANTELLQNNSWHTVKIRTKQNIFDKLKHT